MYRALLVDFDGVIRRWNASDDAIESAYGLPLGSIRQVAFERSLSALAITGQITDEEWRKRTAEQLQKRVDGVDAQGAVAQWTRFAGRLDSKTLGILEQCDPAIRTVLVTNATSKLPRDLCELGLSDRFFAVVNSSEVGISKPDERFFRVALRRAGVLAEQALFVDDTPGHVRSAAALGIRSHTFVEYDELTAFLHASKVLR